MWSAGLQPTGVAPDDYEVAFGEDRAEFARRDGTLTTTMEVLVSAEEDAEIRRISVANAGKVARIIDITSYAELALIRAADDIAHPAFAKMFVQTERLGDAILATRRRRTPTEPEIWPRTFWSQTVQRERSRRKPTAPASWAAGAACATRLPWTGQRCPERPGRCWTRSSPCDAA